MRGIRERVHRLPYTSACDYITCAHRALWHRVLCVHCAQYDCILINAKYTVHRRKCICYCMQSRSQQYNKRGNHLQCFITEKKKIINIPHEMDAISNIKTMHLQQKKARVKSGLPAPAVSDAAIELLIRIVLYYQLIQLKSNKTLNYFTNLHYVLQFFLLLLKHFSNDFIEKTIYQPQTEWISHRV